MDDSNEKTAVNIFSIGEYCDVNAESKQHHLREDVRIERLCNSSSSESAGASVRKGNLTLRNYQRELSKLATEGKNVIICAPPGSGKTLVASHIIMNHLDTHGNDQKKVLFFTPGGTLAQQQCTRLQEHLPDDYTVDFRCGRAETSSLVEMRDVDVIVLTPQMLLNVFKVVGLTATPGVGKNPAKVLNHLKELCANLDAVDGFVTVCDEENRRELYKHIPQPEKQIISLQRRPKNAFHSKLLELFEQAQGQLKKTGEYSIASLFDDDFDLTSKKFQTWCEQLKNEIAEAQLETARDAYTCVEYLENSIRKFSYRRDLTDLSLCLQKCEKAFHFYMMLQPKDAADHLDNFVTGIDSNKLTERERILYEIAKDIKDQLVEMCSNPEFKNPNLNRIENLIARRFRTEPNSKAMLMVETREYAHKLQEWTYEREALKFLKAEVFKGVTNRGGINGLTAAEQRSVLARFRNGDCKMLVNTPESAGEGLDIPDCNLVINYDFLQNEISMIQTKGRVRDKDGEMYSIASKKTERYDNFNAIKAILMEEAVEALQNEISRDKSAFRSQLCAIQREAKRKHRHEEIALLSKRRRFTETEYLIKCKKCSKDLCSSFDLRATTGGEHINVTREFKDKYERKEHARRNKPMGQNWTKKYKMHCKECHADLGIESLWKQRIMIPLLKAKSIRIVSKMNNEVRNQTPKHWVQAPFKPEEVDLDDIESELDHLIEPDHSMQPE